MTSSERSLTAGIIGVNWGVVHLYNLRSAGVHVGGLCATDLNRARAVAAEHGVELATTDPTDLERFDVVVIASPAETHAELLRRFAHRWVICEKPILCAPVRGRFEAASASAFVNYAFGFLDVARATEDALGALGEVAELHLVSRASLPGRFDAERWFLETASHPLAWLLHRFGASRLLERRVDGPRVSLRRLLDAGPTLEVRFEVGGEPGIRHDLAIRASGGEVQLTGDYRPGARWRFGPVRVDGAPVSPVEDVVGDAWLRANARSVEAMLRVFRGEIGRDAAVRRGLFDVETALRVERAMWGD